MKSSFFAILISIFSITSFATEIDQSDCSTKLGAIHFQKNKWESKSSLIVGDSHRYNPGGIFKHVTVIGQVRTLITRGRIVEGIYAYSFFIKYKKNSPTQELPRHISNYERVTNKTHPNRTEQKIYLANKRREAFVDDILKESLNYKDKPHTLIILVTNTPILFRKFTNESMYEFLLNYLKPGNL